MVQQFLNNGQANLEDAEVVVVPIPFEGAISYLSGAALGPQAILEASAQVELYDYEEKIDLTEVKIHTLAVEQPFRSYDEIRLFVSNAVAAMEPAKQFYLGIGGDHTVTIPAIEAMLAHHSDFGIVQFDAHADLRDELDGNPYSHACIMRRIAEMLGPEKILSVGIRAVSKEEEDYMKANKVQHISGNRGLHEDLVAEFTEKLHKLPEKIFLTVDLDGLDPTIMPHVGTPVPGGLSWHQSVSLIRRLFAKKTVIGADVVEIASGEGSARSDFTAALLMQKILTHHIKANR
jgi:agmatinase